MSVSTHATRNRLTLTGSSLAALLIVSHAFNDGFANLLPALLPTIQARFELSETVLAVFVATNSLTANVLQPLFGALSDRWGKRLVGSLGLLAVSVLLSFIASAMTLWLFFILLAFGSLGSAAFHPSATSIVRAASGKSSNKSLWLACFTSAGPAGSALAPIAVLAIIRSFGVQRVPWLMIPGVIMALAIYTFTPQQDRATGSRRPKLIDWQLVRGPVGLLALAGVMRSMAFIGFSNAMPLYLVQIHNYAQDASIIGGTVALYSASSAVGVLLSGFLEPRLGRKRLIIGCMLASLPLMIIVLQVVPGSLVYYVLIALCGALTNAPVPLLVVTAQDLAPHAVATASGMLMGLTWGTAGILYIGIGRLQEVWGIQPAMMVSFVFLIPSAILTSIILDRALPQGTSTRS
ncbi:MAG: MFS transporter [Deinococcota bacterium]